MTGRERVLKALDVVQRLTKEIAAAGKTIYESPTVAEISSELSLDDGSSYSPASVYNLLLWAELEGLIAWPTSERGRDRRMNRTILITEKGQEELEAWRKEQERQTALA